MPQPLFYNPRLCVRRKGGMKITLTTQDSRQLFYISAFLSHCNVTFKCFLCHGESRKFLDPGMVSLNMKINHTPHNPSPLTIKYVIGQCGFVTLVSLLLMSDTKKKSKLCCAMKTNSNYYTSKIKDLEKNSKIWTII